MAKTEEIFVSGELAGTIKQDGRGWKVRTARAIANRENSWTRYSTRKEAYDALVRWARS